MRRIAKLAALAAWLLAAAPAVSETSDLKRLTLRQDLFGFEAVGRLDMGRGGFCTGVLIAPHLVLTAGHCLAAAHLGQINLDTLQFRAGLRDGRAIAERGVRRAVIHPKYQVGGAVSNTNVRHDVALVELDLAIPSAIAAPYRVDRLDDGSDEVSVVSYAQGRAETLSRQARCRVLGRQMELFAFDCDVTFGASGAPVFSSEAGRYRIVSLISSGQAEGGQNLAFGMELPGLVDDLKRALRLGQGVITTDGAGARSVPLLRPGAGTARDIGTTTGGGAKFLRP